MTKEERDNEVIRKIIKSFKIFGISDIRHNRNRPIASFILNICFIDQLASFRYPLTDCDLNKRAEDFIIAYLPLYKGRGMYAIFRHAIIHNYSGRRKFGVTNDKTSNKPFVISKGKTVINTVVLTKEVVKAFKKIEKELNTIGSDARINALNRAKKHPPFMDSPI